MTASRDSSFWVSPDSALKYWRVPLERSDPELIRFAERFVRSEDVVWDVGANVGLFTFAAAARSGSGGKVLAIEPDETLVRLLRRSAAANQGRAADVEVLAAAVSDEVGRVDLLVSARGRSRNRIASVDGGSSTRYLRPVPTVTSNHLSDLQRVPDVVKIDVEGAEEKVLSGAHRPLEAIRPIVLCEVSWSRAAILNALSYVLFDGKRLEGDLFARSQTATFLTVAIPIERLGEFVEP